MSIIQDFDLGSLDTLLRSFTERPQALHLDTQLPLVMQSLQRDHLDLLPLPGQGHTLQRWQTLARVAGCDLALAKLYEGHTDALAILAECGASHRVGPGIWGVWAAEPPDARTRIVERDGERVILEGRKAWCSGALQIDNALVTAWDADEQPQLVAIELSHPSQRIIAEGWQAVGMATTTSVLLEFDRSPAVAIGSPGQYLSRPGFWQGGGGIAACWYGAA
ncbi:acyl-CoA dehydrogenase, partial [Pseudomonas sp. 5P_5.1_Bac1]|nr:acyl-CoA dehydrogenase [Pseudomonas sp. 5P_5.1_Bac1]